MNKYELLANLQSGREYIKAIMIRGQGFLYLTKSNIYGFNDYQGTFGTKDYVPGPGGVPVGNTFKIFENDRYKSLKRAFLTTENIAKITTPNYEELDDHKKSIVLEYANGLIDEFVNEEKGYEDTPFKGFTKAFIKVLEPSMVIKYENIYKEHVNEDLIKMIEKDVENATIKSMQQFKENSNSLNKMIYNGPQANFGGDMLKSNEIKLSKAEHARKLYDEVIKTSDSDMNLDDAGGNH